MPVTTIQSYVELALAKNQTNSMESLVLISRKLVERMNAERRESAVDFNRYDLVRAKSEKASLLQFKAKIADNLSAVSKAKGAIEWIDSRLDRMLVDLQAILGSSDPDARAAAAAAFDEDLDFINSKADGAGQRIGNRTVNLIGNASVDDFSVSDLYTRTSKSGGSAMIEGIYMGARYNVEDAEGDIWRYDEPSDSFVEYSSGDSSSPTGESIAAEGLTLDSFDSTTGAVVFGGTGSLQGTIVRGGIGVLEAGFYNDFADDAAVQRAIDDVTAAIDYVASKGPAIKATAALLQASNQMMSERVSNLSEEIAAITKEEVDETAAKAKAARLKLSLAVNNINLVTQQSTGLIQNLLDLTQGLGAAPGVFGVQGY